MPEASCAVCDVRFHPEDNCRGYGVSIVHARCALAYHTLAEALRIVITYGARR